MNFRTYRDAQGWTLDQAAELLSGSAVKLTGSQVRKHEEGMNIPRPPAMERYSLLTSGAVTADDFYQARRAFLRKQRETTPA